MKIIKSLFIVATIISVSGCEKGSQDELIAFDSDEFCFYASVPFPMEATNEVGNESRKITQRCTLRDGSPYWETIVNESI